MDTNRRFFAIGMEPQAPQTPLPCAATLWRYPYSGKQDWDVSLTEIISKALSILSKEISFDEPVILRKILDFSGRDTPDAALRLRVRLVEATIAVEFDRINQLRSRLISFRLL